MTIALMLVGMLALALLNVPIAVALGIVATAAILIIQGPNSLPNMALVMFDGASSFPLLAIPLFILAGAIMNASSISRRLDRLHLRLLRLGARRPVDGDDRRLDVLCRDFRLGGGRRRRARHHPDPGDELARLLQGIRGEHLILLGQPRHHHPAVDPDDPLRGDGADLGGEDVRRRHPSRHSRRGRA